MHTGIHIVLGIPGPVAYQKGTTTVVTWKRLEGLSTRANSNRICSTYLVF